MRAKLLRALAHLKAAKEHVFAAEEILNGHTCWNASKEDVSAAKIGVKESAKHISELYAKAVFDAVEPAELP